MVSSLWERNFSGVGFDKGEANLAGTAYNPAAWAYKSRFRLVGHYCIVQHRYTVQWSNRVVIDPLKSVSWALVQEGVSDDINTVHDIPLPDYDQDVDPALFTDSGGYPVTCLVNVLYPWTTWDAVNAALAAGRNWGWFGGV